MFSNLEAMISTLSHRKPTHFSQLTDKGVLATANNLIGIQIVAPIVACLIELVFSDLYIPVWINTATANKVLCFYTVSSVGEFFFYTLGKRVLATKRDEITKTHCPSWILSYHSNRVARH